MPEHPIALDELLEIIRKSCSPRVWSLAVTLARGDKIAFEREDEDAVVLRVRSPQSPTPHTVVLLPGSCEWDCDCGSREDPCHHVAAASIALKEAKKRGAELPQSERKKVRVEYRIHRGAGDTLEVERWLTGLSAETPTPVERPLDQLSRELQRQADVDFEDRDFKLERVFGRSIRRAPIPFDQIRQVFSLLDAHPHATFEGGPVRVSNEPLLPRARVRREGDELVFAVEADPKLDQVVVPGVGRASDRLQPLGETGLAGERWEKLPRVTRFPRPKWCELTAELIPLMQPRFPIQVDTPDLPKLVKGLKPRLELGLTFRDGALSLAPELVYGRPPQVRIENGRPIYLQGSVPWRDQLAEHRMLTRLRDELNMVPGRRVRFAGKDVHEILKKLQEWNDRSDSPSDCFDLDTASPLTPSLSFHGDRFDLSFHGDHDGETRMADPLAVLDAWKNGAGLVPLLEGGFAPLPADWLEKYGHRLLLLLSARDEKGEIPAQLLPDLYTLSSELDAPPPPTLAKLRPLVDTFAEIPRAALPGDLTGQLRRYQQSGVDWLSFLRSAGLGAVLADDMGLGKTLQTLCVLSGRTLVVCPTSVVQNWAKEIARFRPALRTCVYHGPKRELDPAAEVVLTTYALLRLDRELLAKESWDNLVLDEAQAIKNPDSQAARAAFALRASFRVSLSGTPLENRLEELWSQLHFTNPGLLGGRRDFDEQYAKPIFEGHTGRAADLRARIRPFVLRRVKEEVAPELPPRTDMYLYAELSDSERQVYEAVLAATKKEVVEKLQAGGGVLAALEALLRLRQAACHPSLVPGQYADSSSKLEVLLEALEQVAAEGHRALVFSQWTSLLDLVEPKLAAAGLSHLRLDGSTVDRASVVDRFQAVDGPPIFLISLKAGGTGLNLTAADHVYFLDPWWNPAVEQQAADRAHRIGQDKPVLVYRLVAKDTVEEKILQLQERKRQLAQVALGEAAQAASISRDDLLALLE